LAELSVVWKISMLNGMVEPIFAVVEGVVLLIDSIGNNVLSSLKKNFEERK